MSIEVRLFPASGISENVVRLAQARSVRVKLQNQTGKVDRSDGKFSVTNDASTQSQKEVDKTTDRTIPVPPEVVRLAAIWWVASLYRRNASLLPTEVLQTFADRWLPKFDYPCVEEAVKLYTIARESTGSSLLLSLAREMQLGLPAVPADVPKLPFKAVENDLGSRAALVLARLALTACALTAEVSRQPIEELKAIPAVFSNSTLNHTATAFLWLLEDSKLSRKKDELSGSELLTLSILAISELRDAASNLQDKSGAAMKVALRQFAEKLPVSLQNLGITVAASACLRAVSDTTESSRRRCRELLLPVATKRLSMVADRKFVSWPGDVELPDTVCVPQCSNPIGMVLHDTEQLLTAASTLSSCPSGFEAPDSQLFKSLAQLQEMLVAELSLAFAILIDEEHEAYINAVAKAAKKKKNISTRISIGRPLRSMLDELCSKSLVKIRPPSCRGSVSQCPDLFREALTESLQFPKLFDIEDLLELSLTPANQGGRIPKVPKGTLDTDPRRMVIREHIIDLVKNTFRRYGADSIDTPIFELRETLMGKYGEDQKLIFDLKDQGGEQLSLRYDLTVPFARYCATSNVDKIRRYHIGKVYRRDEPQMARGRFREFYQCDYDIAGEYDSMVPETEVLTLVVEVLGQLRGAVGPSVVRLNHRLLLDAIMEVSGVPLESVRRICSSIDKLDQMCWSDVRAEMCNQKGLSEEAADIIHRYITMNGAPLDLLVTLEKDEILMKHAKVIVALRELKLLFSYLSCTNALSAIQFDLSLARGLDYYTGIIYEVVLTGQDVVGSVGGGGRYDNLIGMFKGRPVPAVGVSIGVERLFRIIEMNLSLLPSAAGGAIAGASESRTTALSTCPTDVFVCSIGEGLMGRRLAVARSLRQAGIAVDLLYVEKAKIVKQLAAATERRARWVIIFGYDELERNSVKLKRLTYEEDADDETATEEEVSLENLVEHVQKTVASKRSAAQVAWDIISTSCSVRG